MGPTGEAGTTGQSVAAAYGTATYMPGFGFSTVPGLSTTIDVPENASVMITTSGGVQTTSMSTTGVSRVDVAIFVDGALVPQGGYRRVIAANTGGSTSSIAYWSFGVAYTLPPGSHTITVQSMLQSGNNANVSGNSNSVLQGALVAAVVKR